MPCTTIKSVLFLSLIAYNDAFIPNSGWNRAVSKALTMSTSLETPYFVDVASSYGETTPVDSRDNLKASLSADVENIVSAPQPTETKAPTRKISGTIHKEGILSPVVKVAKVALGEKKLNQVRGKVITIHSGVIKSFVETSDSAIGQAALVSLFALADTNGDGRIQKEELSAAVNNLGFTWLKEKQINGIFKRGDLDGNGTLEFEEFVQEAPRILKTNLVKLAKKNGGDLGFLV